MKKWIHMTHAIVVLAASSGSAMASNASGVIHVTGEIVEAPCKVQTVKTSLQLSCWVGTKKIYESVNMVLHDKGQGRHYIHSKGVTIEHVAKVSNISLYTINYN